MSTVKVVHGYEGYKEEQDRLIKEKNIYVSIPDLAKAHELYKDYLERNPGPNYFVTFIEFITGPYCEEIEDLY